MLLFWKKISRAKKNKNLNWSKGKKNIFKNIFERQKQTCLNKEIQPNLKGKKIVIYLFLFAVWKRKKKLKYWVPNSNGSSSTQRHWVLVETRLKVIESYCSDPTTLSDLQKEKTTPSTDATVRQDPTLLICFGSVLGLGWVWLVN
jgi:hypothetical protein